LSLLFFPFNVGRMFMRRNPQPTTLPRIGASVSVKHFETAPVSN